MNNKEEIRVPVKGGYLVATRNPEPDYDGITIVFETSDGDVIDIVMTECKAENDFNQTDVYCFENVREDDVTRKFTIDHEEVYEVFGGKYNND